MDTPLFTWSLTVALLIAALLIHLSIARRQRKLKNEAAVTKHHHHPLFGTVNEEQMLYVAGDTNPLKRDENDTDFCTESDFADYD